MALPLPGSPSSSWPTFISRIKQTFHGAEPRVLIAFWLFGLINNVLYVIILSAALDLVGPSIPKGVVLLADVIPSFLTKLCAPYFIHAIPYSVRILIFVCLSAMGMLLIALSPAYTDGGTITTRMAGVILASLSSGGGELSFLGLVHYYGPFSLAAWGSGTGGAGLIGAGAYALATTSLGFSVQSTLLASAFLPAIMLVSFFLILPLGPLRTSISYTAINNDEDEQNESLLSNTSHKPNSAWATFRTNLRRSRSLFFPFMLPLLIVYIAEYTINQGVAPTLLFPLEDTPFKHYRAFYPTYNAIYQSGVFLSRSSTPFFRIHNLYLPSFLQAGNLLLLALHAMFDFIPSFYVVCVIVFYEGILGGLVYVNTFAEIADTVPREEREFSLSATTVSDSAGICVAGFISMGVEKGLCGWQVGRGRDWCKRL
jgi:battenin